MTTENNNLDFLDKLTVFSVLLQVIGYQDNARQLSNDDIMRELQNQDKVYLEKIIKNQNMILEKLAKLG